MAEFRMPALGADMDEGTVVEWLVKPGDEIQRGDVIAVIDTAKSAIDAESFCSGTIDQLVIGVGQTVPVGTVLATITEQGAERKAAAAAVPEQAAHPAPMPAAGVPAAAAAPPAARPKPRKPPARKRAQPPPPVPAPPVPAPPGLPAVSPVVRHRAGELGVDLAKVRGTGAGGAVTRTDVERAASRRRITPRARAIAAELGVDLTGVSGTGPDGSIREADVRAAAAHEPSPVRAEAGLPAKPAAERTASMRQAIARLMARSKREIPHYYVSNTADMTASMNWLHDRNREREVGDRIVPAALLLKAAAVAARQVPQLNGYWIDDEFRPAEAVHLGLAISLRGGGLLTPAIHDAAGLDLTELMTQMRDLVTRARSGRLRGSELTDATITVTNLGDQGVDSVFGVIYPPQVALVGFGKVTERAVAVNGLVGARPVVVTTLAADHRATDGYAGARFLTAISDLLQRPEKL
jgi:pyruvate dehydrogenase E2 component (dihydrolipoamide acetyltransferase)